MSQNKESLRSQSAIKSKYNLVDLNIDQIKLIKLVGERPLLWDMTLINYKNRSATKVAWNEIAENLITGFANMETSMKQHMSKMLIQKWTHIRDNYNRSVKNKGNKKSVKPYVHVDRLKFLSKVIKPIPGHRQIVDDKHETVNSAPKCSTSKDQIEWSEGSTSEANEDSNGSMDFDEPKIEIESIYHEEDVPETESEVKVVQPVGSQRLALPAQDMIVTIPDSIAFPTINRHLSFFQSILPTVETFDDSEVLEFQMGVLRLLKNIKNSRLQAPDVSIPSFTHDIKLEVFKEEID